MADDKLFSQFVVPPLAADLIEPQALFGVDWRYNWATADLELDETGDILLTTEDEAWAQESLFGALTERYEHLCYPPQFGNEMQRVYREGNREVAIIEAQRVTTDAIMADDRIDSVSNFVVEEDAGDLVKMRFTVTPKIGTDRRLSIQFIR